MSTLFNLAGPFIRMLDAEKAHQMAIAALKSGMVPVPPKNTSTKLKTSVLGLDFPNPVGLAPGFDKNGEVPNPMLDQGFGFVEIGTVTPKPQSGNDKPRLFRLARDKAVINRMGFNNDGHARVAERLGQPVNGVVGVNIGANKTSDDRIDDYVKGLKVFNEIADYLTVNISSPNTPGLRGLQSARELTRLLSRLGDARAKLKTKKPMLLKIAPDLPDDELDEICQVCLEQKVDGLIISNTTLARNNLTSQHRDEAGGLSGQPLFEMSTKMLARAHKITSGKLVLVGVGGISNAAQAFEKIRAGASLVQLYSAMVYEGPDLANKIANGLEKLLQQHNLSSIQDAVGKNATAWQ